MSKVIKITKGLMELNARKIRFNARRIEGLNENQEFVDTNVYLTDEADHYFNVITAKDVYMNMPDEEHNQDKLELT